ncbi:MAG: chromate transporter [Lentimicrobiaceae bacterium]|nr:chromate transporter [Lentimicrobiaceae bacterium]
MVYLLLFWVYFKVGLFGFGGGYAMISMIQYEVVEHYAWMSSQEFADVLAISQMTPGPISINSATYVGYSVGGVFGAFLATFSLCLPMLIIMYFVIRYLFTNMENHYVKNVFRFLKPATAGLIFAVGLLLMNAENFADVGLHNSNVSVAICAVSFVASYFYKVNPILLLAISGLCGYVFFGVLQ